MKRNAIESTGIIDMLAGMTYEAIRRYEDDYMYYARKPHGIPTTFGSQFSFLEALQNERSPFFVQLADVRTFEEEL